MSTLTILPLRKISHQATLTSKICIYNRFQYITRSLFEIIVFFGILLDKLKLIHSITQSFQVDNHCTG